MCVLQTHETERTDFWCKSSIGTWFTTGGPQVDDFDFIRILKSGRLRPRYRPKHTKILTNFGAIAARDLGYDLDLTRGRGKRSCGLGMDCTAGRGGGGDKKSRERERADRTGEDRTFVSDRNALNDRFATPLTDIEGRSHYGRMEPESELILLPPSFEHVDQDHLCSLIGLSPCSRAPR